MRNKEDYNVFVYDTVNEVFCRWKKGTDYYNSTLDDIHLEAFLPLTEESLSLIAMAFPCVPTERLKLAEECWKDYVIDHENICVYDKAWG